MSSSTMPAKKRKDREEAGGPPSRPVIRAGDPVRREKPADDDDDDIAGTNSQTARRPAQSPPEFPALAAAAETATAQSSEPSAETTVEYRKVRIPAHRYTPLRKQWEALIAPLTEHLKLQVRFNPRTRCVELKTCAATHDAGAIQKGADYVGAFALGFEVRDAVALLRLDDLFVDSFEVKDVKILHGDHLSRAVGRVAGADGKTRYAIENATRTRIVLANTHVHILGATANIRVARDAVCDLIMGAPPGKVYNRMRTVAKRLSART